MEEDEEDLADSQVGLGSPLTPVSQFTRLPCLARLRDV